MRHSALAGAIFSSLTACAVASAVVMDPTLKLPPICPDGVALFTAHDKIATDYREIAFLDASGPWEGVTNTMLYQAQRKKAAKLGANAIIVGRLSEPTTGGKLRDLLNNESTAERRSSATAIYISADTQRVRVACAAKI